MDNIQLEGRIIERHYGRNVNTAPELLARYEKCEGVILSEVDTILLKIKHSEIRGVYWNTSTLSATKGETVKVILPYETGSRTLTESARFGLGLINPNEKLVNYGVNLDIDGRWGKYCDWNEGNGVYTLQRKELILDKNLTKTQAMKHKLLLTKLGHPDHVDPKFARSTDEVAEIIEKTFELGKSKYNYRAMMGQCLPDISDKGVLKTWYVDELGGRVASYAWTWLDNGFGVFAFDSVGDAKSNIEDVDVDKARAQLQALEGMLQSGQIDQIGNALGERDELRKKLLTIDQIYSVIGDYFDSINE